MDTMSVQEVATRLGTSRKRVTSAAVRLGLCEARSGRRIRFTPASVDLLREVLGIRRVAEGLTEVETRVLATVAARPRGVASRRSLARMAGLSTTAASNAVAHLIDLGLLREFAEIRALGRARPVTVMYVDRSHSDWPTIAVAIHDVRPPAVASGRNQRVPSRLRHAFWNMDEDTFRSLRADSDGAFLAARAISSRDPEVLAWAATALRPDSWRRAATARGRTDREKAMALNLAGAGERNGFVSESTDLRALVEKLSALRPTAVHELSDDTFNGVFGQTRIQFLQVSGQTDLESPAMIAGIRVAGLRDLMATKLKVIADRGELRDYFDLMVLDQYPGLSLEQGLSDYRSRYHDTNDNNLVGIVLGLGYLGDVMDDPGLPGAREEIETFWRRRQPELLANLGSIQGRER